MWITWKHERGDFGRTLTFDEKVEVFYEQTLGWQLHIADLVANGGTTFGEFKQGQQGYAVASIRHSGFAVLHMCLSYIELVGSLVDRAARKPMERFESGLRAIPGLIEPKQITPILVRRLYDGARCGLYHEGRTRQGVGLGEPPDGNAIAHHGGVIGISPERLPRVLKVHLQEFTRQLLIPSNKKLRGRFEERFDSGFTQ